MANFETAYGLKPVSLRGGIPNPGGVSKYFISATNTNPIYKNGIVTQTAAGTITHAGDTAGGTTAPVGVLCSVYYFDADNQKIVTHRNYWPGAGKVNIAEGTEVVALVYDNPDQIFKVASDKTFTSRATARAYQGSNASLGTSARTGVTLLGTSNSTLSVDSIATTATLPLRIIGFQEITGANDYTSAGIPVLVTLNAHFNAEVRRYDEQTTAPSTGI